MQDYELDDIQQEESSSGLGGIEWLRLYLSVKKSILWLLLFVFASVLICHYYLKYTKPTFLASSLIKLDVQTEASDIGLGSNFVKQLDNLQGEIELIRSPLVAEEVLNNLDLNVSYFAIGTVMTTELYRTSPFKLLQYEEESSNVPFDIELNILFEDNTTFSIYEGKENDKPQRYKIGQKINYNGFLFSIIWNENMAGIGNQKNYIVIINSKGRNIGYLLGNIGVEIVNKDARTISISFQDYNKSKAVAIVNMFDSVYLKQSLVKKLKSQEQTLNFIETQLEATAQKLDNAEKDIETFIRSNKTSAPGSEFSGVIQKIEELEIEKLQMQTQFKQLQDVLNFVQKDKSEENIIPLVMGLDNAQIASSINSLNGLFLKREILKISNKETTTPFKTIDLEISLIKSQLLDLILESKRVVGEKQQMVTSKINELNASFLELPSLETEFNRLKRYNSLYEKFYLSLLDRQIQFQISKAGTVPEFTILSPARASSDPIHPVTGRIWMLFILGGLAPGILMMGIRYLLMNVVLDLKDAEKRIVPPILGLVPGYKHKMDASTLVVDQNPKSSISESLRSVRSNADFMLEKKSNYLIGVTSTVSGEGKTMFAINFAAIQSLGGKKVIILDFDMRKPKIHVGFGVQNNVGVSTILVGQTQWKDAVRSTRLANLDYITSGPTPPNPSELILRKEFDQLIYNLFEEYDIVMIDTPPIGLVTDASAILSKTDLSVYVIRAGYSHKSAINNVNNIYKSKKLNNLSVVINDVKVEGMYGYKYGYAYGYGYGYYEEDNKKKSFFKKLFGK